MERGGRGMDYMQSVREYIGENFLFGDTAQLREDTSFLSSNIIDSTGVLELVNFLEERYNVTIGDDEIIPENLDSLINIDQYLKRKVNG
jgi:acyl carrier protein